MEDGERIPIDIGYEVAALENVGAETDPRITTREDGTIVIDILAEPACAPDPSTGEEIVVCAAATDGSQYRPLPSAPPGPAPLEKLEEALTATVGPLVITPFGVRLRF